MDKSWFITEDEFYWSVLIISIPYQTLSFVLIISDFEIGIVLYKLIVSEMWIEKVTPASF